MSAFVEGRLDAQQTARFSAQVQHDLALAERVARQRALQRRAPEVAATPAVPAAAVVPADAAIVAGRARPSAWWWMGSAAAVLLAAWAGTRLPENNDAPLIAGPSGVMAAGRLAEALTTRGFIEGPADGVLISLSFRGGDGRYCRTFSLDIGIDGLACRDDAGWLVESIGRSPGDVRPDGAAVQPVSTQLSPSVLAAIARWQAGDALTPEEERRVRDRDWR